MKKLLFTALMCAVSLIGLAQTEPEFEYEPFVFNRADSAMNTALPCENAYEKAKAGASLYITGIGKVKTYYYVDGIESSLKLDKSTSDIVVNTGGKSPMQTISIVRMELLKSKRRWKSGEAGSFTGATAGTESGAVDFKYKKFGSSSVIISTKNFEPGEYCLSIINQMTNSKSSKVYTFSIK